MGLGKEFVLRRRVFFSDASLRLSQDSGWVVVLAWAGDSVVSLQDGRFTCHNQATYACMFRGLPCNTISHDCLSPPGGNLGVLGLGVGGGCGFGLGLGWGVGVGWGSKYINQHFVFEETTKNTRRSNDDSPQVWCHTSFESSPPISFPVVD